ncbi:lipopolysaccharide heptosyltransferase I [Herbaspirillum huttiense]|uniref:lipopolysaccharide heptosyltransferase I n=1 Tax=Herbaspirillum TaxID=963 RepID=UPI000C0A6151|nr:MULTISPECIES: lipopolysaccharide heptosyltransferase I [Herbaspirillum]MAF02854.1 lipopolysaccharide heptosyltransferase I [Herbaspirillum sp.]MBN9355054.1 lipopolysaccharide heptosyltransferase I [Herbaspirillum huttiense]MBO15378.1 lipopolysaccharide heptosyltransferase I [Herbaspirillum sp.]
MNILIVRVSSLGDVVHNMPMVADIHRHFPAAQIDWVVEEGYTSLVGLNPHVRKIIPIALRRWRKTLFSAATRAEIGAFRRELQAERYDLVFDTQGLLKTSVVMRMARLAPQGRRIGLANATEGSGYEPISRIFHDQSIPVGLRTHAVTRARLVAAAALGYQLEGQPDFALQPPEPARWAWMPEQPYVVFFHGTARAAKQWPQAQWIKLGQALAERGLQILLPWGSAREQEAARQLAAGIPGATVLPALPMMQAVALVQQARLVVGLDTGLTHIAAAYGKPTIELYCDSPRWKTEGNWSPAIINLGDLGAPPSEEDVLKAALGLLA